MTMLRLLFAAAIAVPLAVAMPAVPAALAEGQGVVAVVNDVPVTEHDITQRITLMKTLGDGGPNISRKQALQSLIDEQVKIAEAKKYNVTPTDRDVRDQIDRIAKNMKTTAGGLTSRLGKQGISADTFNRYVNALIGFNRIIASKYRQKITVSAADVDAKLAEIKKKANAQIGKIMNDPRMKSVTVYSLMEISLPVDGQDVMLLQSRAIEARQVMRQFKGCGNARAAAAGVFNVKVGKRFDADSAKLPKQMKAALDQAGEGNVVGPLRGKDGIQLIAFCGSRKVSPPKPDFKMPTRDQVERLLINEKYDVLEQDYLKTARQSVYVEYLNSSYAKQ